ncbi:hypothetical protein AI2614V1_4103 [Klebsiella oxytoca]|nr:hypothetical protein AI2614V1_4103 [Klebsiella oxytoca]CAH3791991.1 hypothetical protein AI2614V1_4103 [Klebsiella oxytoca]
MDFEEIKRMYYLASKKVFFLIKNLLNGSLFTMMNLLLIKI